MTLAAALFWSSFAAAAYVLAGYPAALALWAARAPRPVRRGERLPTVAIVIAARDEVARLARKVRECLAFDYPPERLSVVLSLDAPTDGTDAVAAALAGPRVSVVSAARHEGKAAALNRALETVAAEVVVFCDARQRVAPGAVRALVADLHDEQVGAVTGELVLEGGAGGGREGVSLYWRYEKALRALESRVHSCLGVTGALYALRRRDWAPLPPETILDDVLVPMRTVLSGRRTVFEPLARATDAPCDAAREYRRKVRTLAGNVQLLWLLPGLLSPRRNPVFLQFVSHKLGRLLLPWALLGMLASSLVLAHGVYAAALAAQAVFYLLAAAAAIAPARAPRLAAVPYAFVVMNLAAVAALRHVPRLRRRRAAGAALADLWIAAHVATEEP